MLYSLFLFSLGSFLGTLTPAFHLLAFIYSVDAYSFNIDSKPTACRKLSISINGTDGQPPYSLVLIPYGPSPLGTIEVRLVETYAFADANATSLEFSLNWPANSQFVAVVSDQSGFASGGTSAPWKIISSGDTSCFDSSRSVSPRWPNFFISPDGLIRSCETSFVYWIKGNPNITGTVQFYGVIPSGTSFAIESTPTFDVAGEGTGFNWTVPANAGTDLILVSGDETIGAGGYVDYTVSPSENATHVNCSANIPTTTAYPPAGGDPSLEASLPLATVSELHQDSGVPLSVILGPLFGCLTLIGILGVLAVSRHIHRRKQRAAEDFLRQHATPFYTGVPYLNRDNVSGLGQCLLLEHTQSKFQSAARIKANGSPAPSDVISDSPALRVVNGYPDTDTSDSGHFSSSVDEGKQCEVDSEKED